MKADDAQRLVIRALVEPDEAPCAASSTADPLGAKLALFGGFIARIKHAQLRRTFPLTLRLLAIDGADIAFFAGIAADFQVRRSQGTIPQAELVERFANALRQWLSLAPAKARRVIAAMLRHEQIIWTVTHEAGVRGDCDYPMLAPGVTVANYDCDVLAITQALRTDPFVMPACEPDDLNLLYSAGDGTVGVRTIDMLSAWVLSRLDGRTTVSEICRQWPGETEGFERVVSELVADGCARRLVIFAAARTTA